MARTKDLLHFVASLLAVVAGFYVLYQLEPQMELLQELIAANTRIFLYAFGLNPVQQGYFLFLEGHGLEVAAACVGWRSMLAFIGLVAATPNRKNKSRALAYLPVIHGFNLLRLMTSLLSRIWIPDWFDLIHGFLWTYGMTLLVLGLWWRWAQLGAQRGV